MSRVFVGGYIALYKVPSSSVLFISKDQASKFLNHRMTHVDLNIEHNENATVGRIYRIFDVTEGLFCIGEILSARFFHLMNEASRYSKLVSCGPQNGLHKDPLLEYLSICFPALSLASRLHAADSSFFKHVSLCGLGKRRGTLAIYGRSVPWIVSRFENFSKSDRSLLNNFSPPDKSTVIDGFNLDASFLFAIAADCNYIKERSTILKIDKRLAGANQIYVKASALETLKSMNPSQPITDGVYLSKDVFLSLIRQNMDPVHSMPFYQVYDPRFNYRVTPMLPPPEEPTTKRRRLEFPLLPGEITLNEGKPETPTTSTDTNPPELEETSIPLLLRMITDIKKDIDQLTEMRREIQKLKENTKPTDTVNASHDFIDQEKSMLAKNKHMFVNALTK